MSNRSPSQLYEAGSKSMSRSMSAKDVMSPVVSVVMSMASAVGEGADAASILKFMLDGIRVLGDGVGNFIKALGDEGLGNIDDGEILDAYYDATLKCKTAALNVLRSASGSLTQLCNLQGALLLMDTNEAAESVALNEIMCLDCTRFNLPETLLSDLEAAKTAYEQVIHLCSMQKEKTQRVEIIAYVSIGGLILLGLVLTPAVVSVPILFLSEVAVETVVQVSVLVGGMATLVGISSAVAKQIMDLCDLMKALRVQWELLKEAQSQANGLVLGISQLQVVVELLQVELQNTGQATGFAQRVNSLFRLRGKAFREDLDKQICDLQSLKQSSRQLTENAVSAFDYFKEKNNVITRRVMISRSMACPKSLSK